AAHRYSMAMVWPSIQPRSRSPCWKASRTCPGPEPSDRQPIRGIFAGDCARAVSGAVSRLRVSMTMHPAVLDHMVVSLSQPHADLLLSIEAERQPSAAAGRGSEARADAGGTQLPRAAGGRGG